MRLPESRRSRTTAAGRRATFDLEAAIRGALKADTVFERFSTKRVPSVKLPRGGFHGACHGMVKSIGEQLRGNAVAIISLMVALSSLGYNTWRNERTEHNRNVRTAAFEVLMRAADLERVVFLAQYDRDARGGSPRAGWTDVLEIRDLSALVPGAVPTCAADLEKVWGQNWEDLGKDDETAVNRIDDAISRLREATLAILKLLR